MASYKNKECVVCGELFKPTSPKQKVCEDVECRSEIRRRAERKRYRKKQNTYVRICKVCNAEFQTTDSRRIYCGSEKCELERVRWKNSRSNSKRKCRERTYQEIYDFICSLGYVWVDGVSEGSYSYKSKIKYRCKNGHVSEVMVGRLNCEYKCKKCSADNLKNDFNEVKSEFESEGYKVLSSSYVDNKSKLDCSSIRYSKAERELYDFVCSLVGEENVIGNDRSLIYPYELDIFIPAKNLAIEYCGLYWHSEISGGKENRYHYDKMIACNDKNIRLITIFEDEYSNYPEVVKSRVRNALKIPERRIYARKCNVREIDLDTSRDFLNKYHLQGYSPCKIRWGLYYKGELVQVLTAGSLARAHTGKDGRFLEMKRFASVPGVSVVGGAGKLFKRMKKYAKDNNFTKVKSYCDMRYAFQMKPVYEVLGFELKYYTKWTPHYIKGENRYRNQKFRKTPEERKTGLTEWQLRRAQGYDRIWDCGHRTYIYKI